MTTTRMRIVVPSSLSYYGLPVNVLVIIVMIMIMSPTTRMIQPVSSFVVVVRMPPSSASSNQLDDHVLRQQQHQRPPLSPILPPKSPSSSLSERVRRRRRRRYVLPSDDIGDDLRQLQQQQRQQGQALDDTNDDENDSNSDNEADKDEREMQWNLFVRHHVGSWNGLWTTVNDMADVLDETIARTHLELVKDQDVDSDSSSSASSASSSPVDDDAGVVVMHTHEIPVVSTSSNCDTCFDNPALETKTIPVATHRPHTLLSQSKIRLASRALVVGPKILPKSGSVAIELGLRYRNCRVRVLVIVAPAWEPGVEPMSCLPHALKVARVTLHREVLSTEGYDPTPSAEEVHFASQLQQQQETESSSSTVVRFHKGVPPFSWHKDWSGTSWTWGPQTGNRGWQLDQLELEDQWHGNNPVERWNWRSQSVFVQLPKLVTSDETGIFRLAWLADSNHLLRVEAGITALRPVVTDEQVIGLEPPVLVSLRCDTLQCKDD